MFILIWFYLIAYLSIDNIGALDGIIGAVILDGQSFITLANVDYIPLPPFGKCRLKLHADSHYGDNNPI